MDEITQHGVEGQQTALQNPRIDSGVRLASKIARSKAGTDIPQEKSSEAILIRVIWLA